MERITNKNLSNILGCKLGTIKRWATYFCEPDPDPAGGQHSFKTRVYTVDEALKICLGGYMIGLLRFRINEAKMVMGDISGWLYKKSLSFSDVIKYKSEFVISIIFLESGFCYEVREIMDSNRFHRNLKTYGILSIEPKYALFKESYVIHRFGAWKDGPEFAMKTVWANRQELRFTHNLLFLAHQMAILS